MREHGRYNGELIEETKDEAIEEMPPKTVLVDESGDSSPPPGDDYFTMTAMTTTSPDKLADIIDKKPHLIFEGEVKFHDTTEQPRKEIIREIVATNPEVTAVYAHRDDIHLPPKEAHRTAARELLGDVADGHRGEKLYIRIDKNTKLKRGKIDDMVKDIEKKHGVIILSAKDVNSKKDQAMQAHDFVSSSVGKNFNEPNKTSEYLDEIPMAKLRKITL